MKKVLVIGSSGFIGRELMRQLVSLNKYEVLEFNSKEGRIEEEDCFNELDGSTISHVFHLAGRTFVPESWEAPQKFMKVNTLGTQNVLEFCRKFNLPITYVSAYVYGIPESLPIKESDIPQPNNPYALSKFMGEELCRFYSKYYNLKTCILRPFNVYGFEQPDHFLIPILFKQALDNDTDKIVGQVLEPKRDFVHVTDVAKAIIKTVDFLSTSEDGLSETFNIGSGESYSVKEVAQFIRKVVGSQKEITARNISRPQEIVNTVASIQKSKEKLNWQAKIDFKTGLEFISKKIQDSEK